VNEGVGVAACFADVLRVEGLMFEAQEEPFPEKDFWQVDGSQ